MFSVVQYIIFLFGLKRKKKSHLQNGSSKIFWQWHKMSQYGFKSIFQLLIIPLDTTINKLRFEKHYPQKSSLFHLSICKVKLATIVEGNPKAPFSIATTPMCRGGRYSFPGLLYFTLDPYLIMLSAKQGSIKYHFLSLWYDSTWDWTQVSRAIGEHSNP